MNAIKKIRLLLLLVVGGLIMPTAAIAEIVKSRMLHPEATGTMTLTIPDSEAPPIMTLSIDLVNDVGAPVLSAVEAEGAAEWLSAREGDQISFSYTLNELDTLQLLESGDLVAYNDSSESALDAIIASEMIAYMETFDRVGGGTGATPDSAADVTIVATATLYDGMRLESTTMASDIGGTVPGAFGSGISVDGAMTVSAVTADGVVLEVAAVALGEEVTELLEGAGLGTLASEATTSADSITSALGLAIAAVTWGASPESTASGGGWAQALA